MSLLVVSMSRNVTDDSHFLFEFLSFVRFFVDEGQITIRPNQLFQTICLRTLLRNHTDPKTRTNAQHSHQTHEPSENEFGIVMIIFVVIMLSVIMLYLYPSRFRVSRDFMDRINCENEKKELSMNFGT